MTKKMNKINQLFCSLGAVFLLALLSGCRSDLTPVRPVGDLLRGGRRLGTSLTVAPTESARRTKSAFTGSDAAVSDWTLLQFDTATGLLAASYYQASGADITDIAVVTDHGYDWYAVANVGDVRSQFTVGVTPESSMAAWYATGFDMTTAVGLPMAWKGEGLAFSQADLTAGRRLAVTMTRLVARYDITVDKSALSRYAYAVTGATIEGPASVRAFADSKGTSVATTTDAATASDVAQLNSGGAASFYAAENRYGEMAISHPDSKKPRNIGADDHPTFIEISGVATLLDGSGLSFPATYRFYLGQNATSNFDVIRNTENTVTLHLTDAKIDAGRAERDVIDAGGMPDDPLWKVAIDPYADTRSLQFEHGAALGGAGIRLAAGSCTAEGLLRVPDGLSYAFRLDQVLYDAGVRVFRQADGTEPILPASGYTEATWIPVEGSPATLYFSIPTGVANLVGQAHVRTLDGRKSDDLTVTAGRILDHLAVQFGAITNVNTDASPTGVTWGKRYGDDAAYRYDSQAAAMDTILMQNMNNAAYANGYALRVYAVYNDGSEQLLGNDAATAPYYHWQTVSTTGIAAGVSGGYGNGEKYFHQKLAATSAAARLIRTAHSGTSTVRLYYAEEGVTRSFFFKLRVHVGLLKAWPASSTSARLAIPATGTVDLGYWWVDNNGQDSVNVTTLVAADNRISVTTGSNLLQYDGLVDSGRKVRFTGKGTAGKAQSTVSGTGYISHGAVATLFGESADKVRAASLPSTNGINSGNFNAFRYAYFTLEDNRALDRVEVVPDYIYVPDLAVTPADSPGSGTRLSFKLYAYYEGSDVPVDVTTAAIWTRVTGTPGSAGNARVNYYMGWLSDRSKCVYGRTPLASETSCYGFSDGSFWMKCSRMNVTNTSLYESYLAEGAIALPAALYTASYTFNGRTRTASIRGITEKEAASLVVTPETVSVYTGETLSLQATVYYTDGTSATVTNEADWQSDAAGLLTNQSRGSYTAGPTAGSTSVTARYAGLQASAAVTVLEREVTSFTLEIRDAAGTWQQASAVLTLGGRYAARLRVNYAGGTTGVVTGGFTLVSSQPTVAAQDGDGVLRALAIGAARITATYKGKNSSNGVQLSVQNHDYTYQVLVSTRSSGTYAEILADAGQTARLDWDETQAFYAWYVTFDNGVFDSMTDVSSAAAWTVADELLAVGNWNASRQTYRAANTSGASASGSIRAAYQGASGTHAVVVQAYEAPYLRIVEAGPLTWDCWAYGTAAKQTFHIESNVAWTLSGATADWYVSRTSGSGDATITVYPLAENRGADDDITLTVSAAGGLSAQIDLLHDGLDGRGAAKLWWSVEVTPTSKTLAVGEIFDRFTAVRVAYKDGARTQEWIRTDISNVAVYEVSDAAVARVVSLNGSSTTGQATGLAAGTVTVKAWWAYSSAIPMAYREGSPVEIPGEATLTVTATPPPETYRIRTAVQPSAIDWNGTAQAAAWLQRSTDGINWSDVREVKASVTFTSGNPIVSVAGAVLTANNAQASTVTVSITAGNYGGSETVAAYVPVDLTVGPKPVTPVAALSASPTALAWAWDASGSSAAQTIQVTATNCSWSVASITSGFDYQVNGSTVSVWPVGQNTASSALTGTLVIRGTDGVADVPVSLSQAGKPAPTLTALSFDQSHYDLVRVVSGAVVTVHAFAVTAHYSDGSSADVTAAASYTDQGAVTVNGSDGTLTATAACTARTLTAAYGGLTVSATYAAEDLEFPMDLQMVHFESQEDQSREFVITSFEATLQKALSGTTREDTVTDEVQVVATTGPVVEDTRVAGMLLFHFTTAGTGSVTFTYTKNAVTLTRILEVTCSTTNHISYTWH